jgi:predicted RNA-binding Zn ribbon-like protein
VTDSWRGYHLCGGHTALDLTNTVSWRDDPGRRVDRLDLPGFLAHWLRETGLGTPDGDLATVLPAVRDLRELVHAVCTGPSADDLARFAALLPAAHARAATAPTLPVRWHVPVTTVHDVLPALVLRTDELLRSPEAAKVHRCEARGCGWLFVDTTRNHSRRWCRTEDCGNRERVRRHYRKARETTP